MHQKMITSPCSGVIEEVTIDKNSRVYEWETLFKIRKTENEYENICVGLSGIINSLEVVNGDEVISGMVLAYLEEDMMISGSD